MLLVYNKHRNFDIAENISDNVILMKNPDKNEIKKAKSEFGKDVVDTVQEIVYMSDPDTAYCLFDDLNMPYHIVCLEELYFGT